MSQIVLSRPVFDSLVRHLANIEEEKDRIMDEYYPNITKERDEFRSLLETYISEIEGVISNVKINESEISGCPFVTIGSIVEIEDLHSGDTERFRIVSPFRNKVNMNSNCASYLSPMGRALLMKKINDSVEIKTPAGKSAYSIKAIELPV